MIHLVKIVLVFVLILLALRKKINLGATLVGAAFLLLFFSAISPLESLKVVVNTFFIPDNLDLIANVVCITLLGNTLSYTGQLDRLIRSTRALLKEPRLVSITLPALVGILPIPGGAIFSAPMVEASRTSPRIGGDVLAFINYWFRHVWEYFLPLYPAVLLASSLSGLSLSWMVIHHFPFFLLAILGGWLVVRKMEIENPPDPVGKVSSYQIIQPFLPLLPPILGIFLGIPVWLGGLMGVVLTLLLGKLSYTQIVPALFQKFPWLIMLDVVGILIFKTAITEGNVLRPIMDFMISQEVPILPLSLGLAFFVALISGLSSAFVGITFPLVFPLFSNFPLGQVLPLLYVGGYLGILFSPTHLCLILSCRYFKTDIEKVYRLLLWPSLLVLSWGVVWYFIY